ncbi:MAG: exodeoxyribonuclease VII small subunit [Erysipelotrichaceae bacterium]|nr:exodeoxyribonuclease VII small subunit [Erysipelotrichaceae bacterium]
MNENKPTFESSMQRLDEIVNLLEKNQCTLDESIALFEEGLKLSQDLSVQLKSYEDKVARLLKESAGE